MAEGPAEIFPHLSDQLLAPLREANNSNIYGIDVGHGGTALVFFFEPLSAAPSDQPAIVRTPQTAGAQIMDDGGMEWFEKVHLVPRRVAFGQILTTVQVDIELYNAFRRTNQFLVDVINNVGAGLTIINLPPLAHQINHMDGLVLTLEATINGAPAFDSTIDFEIFGLYFLSLEVSGQRVITFPYAPEAPMVEWLRFLTDVLENKDGTEQRINLRKAPRQEFDMRVIRDSVAERAPVDNLLFDWQGRSFGVPVWFEPTRLTADVAAGAFTISVQSTDFADYRVGDLAIIIESETKFDSLVVQSFTANSITFTTELQNSYNVINNVHVYPLRVCSLEQRINANRKQRDVGEFFLRFRAEENNISIASTSAFSTHNSKVLLDDPNMIEGGQLQYDWEREIIVLESQTGLFRNTTPWAKSKSISSKGWAITSRQKLWQVRQLLHALRGRQVSFYLPTFQNDMTPTQPLTNGLTSLQIANIGYAKFSQHRSPRNVIRVTSTAGVKTIRTITNSVEAGAVENLTINTAWTATLQIAEVARIEFLELVRLDADEIRIDHINQLGNANLIVPVKTVFD